MTLKLWYWIVPKLATPNFHLCVMGHSAACNLVLYSWCLTSWWCNNGVLFFNVGSPEVWLKCSATWRAMPGIYKCPGGQLEWDRGVKWMVLIFVYKRIFLSMLWPVSSSFPFILFLLSKDVFSNSALQAATGSNINISVRASTAVQRKNPLCAISAPKIILQESTFSVCSPSRT